MASGLAASNRRTRRYAVVAHDQAIEYTDKLVKRVNAIADADQDRDADLNELFERLQAVEQYIRVDYALEKGYQYSNGGAPTTTYGVWRGFREAVMDKIGRIVGDRDNRNH